MRIMRSLAIAGLAVLFLSAPALADNPSTWDTSKEVGMGFALAISNIFYGVGKVGYAVLGTAVTPIAWTLTGFDGDVARSVFYSSVRGDYSLTRQNLTSEEPFDFVGRVPDKQRPASYSNVSRTEEGF